MKLVLSPAKVYFKIVRTVFLLYVFCCIGSKLIAQEGNATIKDNDLERSPNLSIGGTFLGVGVYNPNLNFFVEGAINYRFKSERIWLKGHCKLAFFDRLEENLESNNFSQGVPAKGTQPLRSIGGSVGYNFKRKEQFMVARATFFKRGNSINLPIKSLKLYGVHGGFETFRTVLADGSTTSYSGTVNPSLVPNGGTREFDATPMFNMNIVSVGIHRQIIQHWVIEVNTGTNETTYKDKSTTMVYADLLFGVNMVLDDVLVPFSETAPNSAPQGSSGNYGSAYNYYPININTSYHKVPFGGRFGWESMNLGLAGFKAGFEAGFLPGIFDPSYNFFITLKLGLVFNVRAK